MIILCPECYKKLQRHLLTSDCEYERRGSRTISRCCDVEVMWINGNDYHRTVTKLKEEKKLALWTELAK